jgi:hypothetical protein
LFFDVVSTCILILSGGLLAAEDEPREETFQVEAGDFMNDDEVHAFAACEGGGSSWQTAGGGGSSSLAADGGWWLMADGK